MLLNYILVGGTSALDTIKVAGTLGSNHGRTSILNRSGRKVTLAMNVI